MHYLELICCRSFKVSICLNRYTSMFYTNHDKCKKYDTKKNKKRNMCTYLISDRY